MSNDLYDTKVQNLVDAINFREPNKVPVGMEFIMWPFAYEGRTYKDVMDDPNFAAETYLKFLDDISLDYVALMAGVPHPVKTYQKLGYNDYVIAKDDTGIEHVQAAAQFMHADEYPELINDLEAFRYQTMFKKKYPVFDQPKDVAYAALKEAAVEYKKFYLTNSLINESIYETRKIVSLLGPSSLRYSSAFNSIFDHYRGITNALVDLRRRPETVREACRVIREQAIRNLKAKPEDYRGKSFPLGMTVYHSECFLSPDQFDEFFFKDFKDIYGPYMEAGAKFFLKGEGRFLNTIDRYRQLPQGAMVMMLDEDDPFEAYKAIGDWATLATGIKSDLLKYGTKQQCIDYVKKCFDTFAPGGGFIFLQNKPFLYAKDVKIENVVAAYEFANEYGKK
ncbi:MAG: hypothetical protein NUK65_02940 [Firmicutes bacterium]|nr:hypothetical protein [Bacillota bacterium]